MNLKTGICEYMSDFFCHLEKYSRTYTMASRPTASDGCKGHVNGFDL